jgi:hypothetical protein
VAWPGVAPQIDVTGGSNQVQAIVNLAGYLTGKQVRQTRFFRYFRRQIKNKRRPPGTEPATFSSGAPVIVQMNGYLTAN